MVDKTDRATEKQRAFAHAYVLGENAGKPSACYKEAYDAEKMSPAGIAVEASKLLDNPKVTAIVEDLRDRQRKRSNMTLDDMRVLMVEAVQMAKEQKNPGVLAQNVEKLAKLCGLWTDKAEVQQTTLSPEQAKPDAAELLRKVQRNSINPEEKLEETTKH